jgi:WD40 repeat protein
MDDRVIKSDAEVGAITFLADGSTLAGTCRDGKVRLWDARSGALKRSFAWNKGDAVVTFSSGLLATVGKDGSIQTWDLQSGELLRPVTSVGGKVRRAAYSTDRKLVAFSSRAPGNGSEDTMHLRDASGKERFAVPAGLGGTSAMAISPGGEFLAAASFDTNVRAWSSRNGEMLRLIDELPVATFAMAFSPDGRYLAAAGVDRTVYLFDAKSWKLARKLSGQPEMISALAFSADSRLLLSGGFSELTVRNPVKVLLWDVDSGKVLRSLPSAQRVDSVAFSPDGALAAASCQQKSVSVWSLASR